MYDLNSSNLVIKLADDKKGVVKNISFSYIKHELRREEDL